MGYTAIIISAGLSSRMGEFKPLLDIGGKPAIIRLLDTIRAAGIEDVVVVTGYKHELLEEALSCLVYNADYESGMFSSVQAGVKYAADKGDALLFLVDVPLVSAETISGLMRAYEKNGDSCFAIPVYKEKNGHPLLIPRVCYKEILDHKGEGGLKEIRGRHCAEMLRYEVDDEGCVLDMDTPEDYERLLSYYGGADDE